MFFRYFILCTVFFNFNFSFKNIIHLYSLKQNCSRPSKKLRLGGKTSAKSQTLKTKTKIKIQGHNTKRNHQNNITKYIPRDITLISAPSHFSVPMPYRESVACNCSCSRTIANLTSSILKNTWAISKCL